MSKITRSIITSSNSQDDGDPAIIITKPGKAMKIVEKKKESNRSLMEQYHPLTCKVCECEFLIKHRVYKDKLIHCPNETCASHIIIGNKCTLI